MEAIELKCPCCGGNIDINDNEIINCTFCGVSLINPFMLIIKKEKKSMLEIGLKNIEIIEEEIRKMKKIIDVEGNATWRNGQDQFYYGHPNIKGGFRSSSNTRVVNGIYITDEMLEKDNGLYMFDEAEHDYIRYYMFCARTLTEYTEVFTEQQREGNKELISQMDSIMVKFKEEKKKMDEKPKVKVKKLKDNI